MPLLVVWSGEVIVISPRFSQFLTPAPGRACSCRCNSTSAALVKLTLPEECRRRVDTKGQPALRGAGQASQWWSSMPLRNL